LLKDGALNQQMDEQTWYDSKLCAVLSRFGCSSLDSSGISFFKETGAFDAHQGRLSRESFIAPEHGHTHGHKTAISLICLAAVVETIFRGVEDCRATRLFGFHTHSSCFFWHDTRLCLAITLLAEAQQQSASLYCLFDGVSLFITSASMAVLQRAKTVVPHSRAFVLIHSESFFVNEWAFECVGHYWCEQSCLARGSLYRWRGNSPVLKAASYICCFVYRGRIFLSLQWPLEYIGLVVSAAHYGEASTIKNRNCSRWIQP